MQRYGGQVLFELSSVVVLAGWGVGVGAGWVLEASSSRQSAVAVPAIAAVAQGHTTASTHQSRWCCRPPVLRGWFGAAIPLMHQWDSFCHQALNACPSHRNVAAVGCCKAP